MFYLSVRLRFGDDYKRKESSMAYNKHKGVLVFMILYTVLFVFDGIRVFDAPLPSSLTTYLVYTIMFLYGCFLFKSELLKKWKRSEVLKENFSWGF